MSKRFDAKAILQEHGYRATLGRIRILELLRKQTKPRTVADLHQALSVKGVDQVTLYRALEAFNASRIVRRIDLGQGNAHSYELADTHHHHVVCTDCGMIKDFEICDADTIADRALKQVRGFASISEHAFELFGLCITCAKK